ncbi:MAG: Hsp20/alpha crystallin family protein [Ginsengibacter sp.]
MSLVKKNGRSETLPSFWDDFLNPDVFNWGNNFSVSGNSMPAVNIKEVPESFLVEMAAPGMEKNDFKIELDGSSLTISAEKQDQWQDKDGEAYNRKEFNYQSFYRSFHLPKEVVDAEKIKATYVNGILKLEVPKKEEAKQKTSRLIDIS